MHEDGRIEHEVYLNIHDNRKDMAEHLIRAIPKEGTVLAYNAEGAEKIRIQELADMYPEYAETCYISMHAWKIYSCHFQQVSSTIHG